jgi:hypothetical protein
MPRCARCGKEFADEELGPLNWLLLLLGDLFWHGAAASTEGRRYCPACRASLQACLLFLLFLLVVLGAFWWAAH